MKQPSQSRLSMPGSGAPKRSLARPTTSAAGPTQTAGQSLRQPVGSAKGITGPSSTAPAQEQAPPARAGAIGVGDRVVASGGKRGVVRYVGTPGFAAGEWAGVELDEALGKNDGAVAGTRYFTCAPNHGLFAKLEKLERDIATVKKDVASAEARATSSVTPSTLSAVATAGKML